MCPVETLQGCFGYMCNDCQEDWNADRKEIAALEKSLRAADAARDMRVAELETKLGAALFAHDTRANRLETAIRAALSYANGRWWEWGERAMEIERILRGGIEGDRP